MQRQTQKITVGDNNTEESTATLDTMKHFLNCKFYETKLIEKDGPMRASYLVNLNRERILKLGQPLISTDV